MLDFIIFMAILASYAGIAFVVICIIQATGFYFGVDVITTIAKKFGV